MFFDWKTPEAQVVQSAAGVPGRFEACAGVESLPHRRSCRRGLAPPVACSLAGRSGEGCSCAGGAAEDAVM